MGKDGKLNSKAEFGYLVGMIFYILVISSNIYATIIHNAKMPDFVYVMILIQLLYEHSFEIVSMYLTKQK